MVEGDKMTNIWSFKSERKHLYTRGTYRNNSPRNGIAKKCRPTMQESPESTNSQNCQDEGHQGPGVYTSPQPNSWLGRPSRSAVEKRCELDNSSSLAVKLVLVKDHAITIEGRSYTSRRPIIAQLDNKKSRAYWPVHANLHLKHEKGNIVIIR